MITTVIFDMNGIIIDDEHLHELAFKEVLRLHNIDLTHELYLKLFAGRTDEGGFEECEKYFSMKLPIEDLLKDKMDKYLELFPENKKTYPGVIELIKRLSQTHTLALTSSSTKQEVELITEVFGVKGAFKLMISANDVTKGKPDPEPYLITAERLQVDPQECVVIEDSASGVASAIDAGMKCIGVTTTHTVGDLEDATIVLNSFDQITDGFLKEL